MPTLYRPDGTTVYISPSKGVTKVTDGSRYVSSSHRRVRKGPISGASPSSDTRGLPELAAGYAVPKIPPPALAPPAFTPRGRPRPSQMPWRGVPAVAANTNAPPKAIADPLDLLNLAGTITKVTSALALIFTPTMLADAGRPAYPNPNPDPWMPDDFQPPDISNEPITAPSPMEAPLEAPDVPYLDPVIPLEYLPTLDVASYIVGRPVRSLKKAEDIITTKGNDKLHKMNPEITVGFTFRTTPNGQPQIRARTRLRPQRNPEKKKDTKVRGRHMTTVLLRGALDMFGKWSEFQDTYQAIMWAVYYRHDDGTIVPAMSVLSHKEIWDALIYGHPQVRLDVIGAIENYVLMDISDRIIGKLSQRVDKNMVDVGWDKDLGFGSLSRLERFAEGMVYQREAANNSFEFHERNAENGLPSLLPILREASGSEALRQQRVSQLWSDSP